MHPYEKALIWFFVIIGLITVVAIISRDIRKSFVNHRQVKDYDAQIGQQILAQRLEQQRKAQIRHIKERDAADSHLFDKVEEARRDFE